MYKFATPNWKPKKIHTHLLDEDGSIREALKTKIDTENFALSHCKVLMRGHRSGSLAEVLATEFQYDNKRLTVYLKKYEDLSVCRLVRKLNEKFRTRISVVEVNSHHDIEERALRYLSLSRLNLSFDQMSTANSEKTSQNFLLMKYQQLNGMSTPSVRNEDEIAHDYQNYGPFNQKKFKYSDDSSASSLSSSLSSSSIFHSGSGNVGQSCYHTVQDLYSGSDGGLEHDIIDPYLSNGYKVDSYLSVHLNHPIDKVVTDDWREYEDPRSIPNFQVTKSVNSDRPYPHYILQK